MTTEHYEALLAMLETRSKARAIMREPREIAGLQAHALADSLGDIADPAIRALHREHPMECEKPRPVNSRLSFETATPCGVCVRCRINNESEHA